MHNCWRIVRATSNKYHSLGSHPYWFFPAIKVNTITIQPWSGWCLIWATMKMKQSSYLLYLNVELWNLLKDTLWIDITVVVIAGDTGLGKMDVDVDWESFINNRSLIDLYFTLTLFCLLSFTNPDFWFHPNSKCKQTRQTKNICHKSHFLVFIIKK